MNTRVSPTIHIFFPVGESWYTSSRSEALFPTDPQQFWKLLAPNALLGCLNWSKEKGLLDEFDSLRGLAPRLILVDRKKKTATEITEKNYSLFSAHDMPSGHAAVLTVATVPVEKICALLDEETSI